MAGQEARKNWVENRILQILCQTPWPLTRQALAEQAGCGQPEAKKALLGLYHRGLLEARHVPDPTGQDAEWTKIWRAPEDVRKALYGA